MRTSVSQEILIRVGYMWLKHGKGTRIDSSCFGDRMWTQIGKGMPYVFRKKYSFTADLPKFLTRNLTHYYTASSDPGPGEEGRLGTLRIGASFSDLGCGFHRRKSFLPKALTLTPQRKKTGLVLGRLRLKHFSGHLPREPGANWSQEVLLIDAPVRSVSIFAHMWLAQIHVLLSSFNLPFLNTLQNCTYGMMKTEFSMFGVPFFKIFLVFPICNCLHQWIESWNTA